MIGAFVATRGSWMENECSPLTTRVLLVEDHEGFRSYVRSALLQRKELELVGVAGDGLEAVEKCRELLPDIVLMDIGLPRLNGLDAARRILAEFPNCRIVFLTQEHAPEILEEALKLGASGYVLKTRAARDLFPAMQSARQGPPFVSSNGASRTPAQAAGAVSDRSQTVAQPFPAFTHSHEVHVYPDEESFVAGLASFITRSLSAQKAVLAFFTEQREQRILAAVERSGIDVKALVAAGRFVPRQVSDLATELLLQGRTDRASLVAESVEIVENMVKANPGRRVCVCGECATSLFSGGRADAAVVLETIWDELTQRYRLEVFCAYLLADARQDAAAYEEIRAAHSLVALH
jgi:DNA-binding NarL/FixJ family response regulator